MKPDDFLKAAKVPLSVAPQEFGLWSIERAFAEDHGQRLLMFGDHQTVLRHVTLATMHERGEVVMEDGLIELQQHLPIWMRARGRVLITGLGLGCVVRGLLANPDVEHIDVIEIDAHIIKVIGAEFMGERRVTIHWNDALKVELPGKWDFAWHDLWTESGKKPHLQVLHMDLIKKFHGRVGQQGAWKFPKDIKRRCGHTILK